MAASIRTTILPRMATLSRTASSYSMVPFGVKGMIIPRPALNRMKTGSWQGSGSSKRAFSVVTGGARFGAIKKYTTAHEWISFESEDSNIATIGITTHAASALGDIVYIELPPPPTPILVHDSIGTVESVKSASDILSPISGVVEETNTKLPEKPGIINQDAEGEGWMLKVKVSPEDKKVLEGLMGGEEYEAFKKGEEKDE